VTNELFEFVTVEWNCHYLCVVPNTACTPLCGHELGSWHVEGSSSWHLWTSAVRNNSNSRNSVGIMSGNFF